MLRPITPPDPDDPVVSLEEFQTHARIDADSPDSGGDQLAAAERFIAWNQLGQRALTTSTWEYTMARWPCEPFIKMPLGNLQSVAWIKYTDNQGVQHTFDPANYNLVSVYSSGDGPNDAFIGSVWLKYNRIWPTAMLEFGEPIVIRFTAGWQDAASVPTDIKTAIRLMAAHLYRNREAILTGRTDFQSEALTMGVESLCSAYVIGRF
jgi:uncharacterized phiE125 gp8 family phage protein